MSALVNLGDLLNLFANRPVISAKFGGHNGLEPDGRIPLKLLLRNDGERTRRHVRATLVIDGAALDNAGPATLRSREQPMRLLLRAPSGLIGEEGTAHVRVPEGRRVEARIEWRVAGFVPRSRVVTYGQAFGDWSA